MIGLGVIAALVIRSFIGQDAPPALSGVTGEPRPFATRDGAAAQPVPNTNSPEHAPAAAARSDSLMPAARNSAFVATIPLPLGQPNTVKASVDAAVTAAPVSTSNEGQIAAESASGADDLTEHPLGWCFRTQPDGRGPWLAVSPPGEPTHELRSDSRVVWNGSRSAWLGTEDRRGPHFYGDIMWQTIDATPYRGSRIEFSAQLQSRAHFVHSFLRTQRATDDQVVLIDYERMEATPQNVMWRVHSDSWARMSIVHDVPTDADVIVFGVAVYNGGYTWIDDVHVAEVPMTTPLTNNPVGGGRIIMPLAPGRSLDVPTNLDFEATNLDSTGLPLEAAGC